MKYQKNDRIHHETFGLGTVISVSEDGNVKIQFDKGSTKKLASSFARMKKVENNEEVEWVVSQDTFPGFIQKTEDAYHFALGTRWQIFFEDFESFFTNKLPEAIRNAEVSLSYSQNHKPLYKLPGNTPDRILLNWPIPRNGIKLVLGRNPETQHAELFSLYPFSSDGVQHELKIERVLELEKHGEAQLDVVVNDEMHLTFFDSYYVANRAQYGPQMYYQFLMYGFSYHCKVVDNPEDVWIYPSEKIIDKMKSIDPKMAATAEKKTLGLNALLQSESGSPDDYYYVGTVNRVEEYKILDRQFFKARTTVAGFKKEGQWIDFELDIYIVKSDLKGRNLFKGDTIEGVLWLHGYLWYPGKDYFK